MIIAVIGNFDPPPHVYGLAEQVGKELARRGMTVVCGGLTGVMEAVCKGAKSEGGTTIGILPSGSPHTANEYVDIPVATNMGYARNVAVVSTGRAAIAVGGAFGTLSEIAYALSYGIPVVSLNSWPLTVRGDGLPVGDGYIVADNPLDAVDKAIAAAEARTEPTGTVQFTNPISGEA
ncbi:MAG: TIGR00725 family protein [Chloroflexota bacterium]|nr:TIGR00725 family protein [Chloroflexota bacterium]MDE2684244.1 TIGR00725 family protein [Chloroflexota bacterium]